MARDEYGRRRHRTARRGGLLALAAVLALEAGAPAAAGDLAGPEFAAGSASLDASVVQRGWHNSASVDQSGARQLARLSQDGSGNRLDLWQSGYGNSARVDQHGSDHLVSLDQHGDANTADIRQIGNGRIAQIEQLGNNNRVNLVQGAHSPNVSLSQRGNGNVATLIQY